jgi:SPP1 family predicted phage head-tail adaptor
MRAGKLDREIAIERATETIDSYGVPVSTWGTLASMRAEIIDAADDEAMRASGASSEATVTFRTRYLPGVTLADRVAYDGHPFNIVQLKEIGRRRGLEIRATRIGP